MNQDQSQADLEKQARARFMAIQLVRLTGIALTLFGLLVIARRVDLPIEAGYVLFAVGLFDSVLAPVLLSRRWKSGGR